ncbi:nitrate- and nitrite sensing domain-containing protein [Streptomyces sp. V4-01]|uniref:histidine kinase n=1 Tax=Actinacidiphila polyblastidii TaxID=3110430 RepID=A0ABU7PC86_9ACTN|nr:nitrate- and nitrite sensing domain-containing protein [Streptomyces sp. V4-01]
MFGALLICAATVLAAAAPGVALAAGDLSAAQDKASAARLAARATVLAHTLADERDGLTVRAAVPGGAAGSGLSAADRARTDRQVADVLPGAPADVRGALRGLDAVRHRALSGAGGPQRVAAAYQPLIDALDRLAGPSTAPLGRAADAAAVQRGDLVAALTAGGGQQALVAAARVARLQEQAALADFDAVAAAPLRARYDQTVTGADTAAADRDLTRLLDGPALDHADRALAAAAVQNALTARIALMRSVEASAATDEAQDAAADRDHRVTVLELRAALAALCLLLVVGILVNLFRSVTRPLAALHRWSRADPESGQGARVVGADEFAAVARRVNALTHEAQALRGRVHEVTAERTAAAGVGTALAAEREGLLRTRDELQRSRDDIARRLGAAAARNAQQITYVNLSLRTLGLVERQLALIEGLEVHEQDPDRLDTLFRLDHLATRMRRNSENLLVLTGTEHSHGATARPVPLVDVARAAVSEIEEYARIGVGEMPEARVAGRAADDVAHLLAELLDNAAAFSDPTAGVQVSGWLLENGEVILSVEDTGVGVPAGRLDAFNELLADADPAPPSAVSGMGLYVVARLAHRHAVRVQLRPRPDGGTTAVVVLPRLLVASVGPEEAFGPAAGDSAFAGGAPAGPLAGFPAPRAGRPPAVSASPTASTSAVAAERPADHQPVGRPEPFAPAASGHPPAGPAPVSGPLPVFGPAPVSGPVSWPAAVTGHMSVSGPAPVPAPGPDPGSAPVSGADPRPGSVSGPRLVSRPVPAPAAGLVPGSGLAPGSVPTPAAGLVPDPVSGPVPAPFSALGPAPVFDPGPSPDPGPGSVSGPRLVSRPVPTPAAGLVPGSVPEAGPGPGPAGLPRRVPRGGGPVPGEAGGRAGRPQERRRAGPVDAEALRRTLGGLQRGLDAGRRDAEREISGGTGPFRVRHTPGPGATGETVTVETEEATRP